MLDCPLSCPCNDISVCVNCSYLYLVELRDLLEKEHERNVKALEMEQKKCYNNYNDSRDKIAPNQS